MSRKYPLDEQAFDKPSEESSYFAGLLLADGSVSKSRPTVAIYLQEQDRQIIEHLRRFLKTTIPIAARPRRAGGVINGRPVMATQNCYGFVITSQAITSSLSRYGVVPGKSKIADVPKFLCNDRHFWRGVVDGDGWVCGGLRWPQVGLCGTKDVVTRFLEFTQTIVKTKRTVKQNGSATNWKVNFGSRFAARIAEKLYRDCTVAIPRKLEAAMELIGDRPEIYTLTGTNGICRVLKMNYNSVKLWARRGVIPGVVMKNDRIYGFDKGTIDAWISGGSEKWWWKPGRDVTHRNMNSERGVDGRFASPSRANPSAK